MPLRPLLLLAAILLPTLTPAADRCIATSGEQRASVVELYTSEGCNSCPPADRWLSTLKSDGRTVALAFHVDYWNRLGWTDRFSSAAYTERQQQVQKSSGSRFAYTPQVLLDGAEWREWMAARPTAMATPSPVRLQLSHQGSQVVAEVAPRAGAALPARLGGYWAVVEDGHVSDVKAGENAGATLRHDHVVRRYQPIAPWASAEPQHFSFELPPATDPAHPRRVVLVVTEAGGRPLQALELGC